MLFYTKARIIALVGACLANPAALQQSAGQSPTPPESPAQHAQEGATADKQDFVATLEFSFPALGTIVVLKANGSDSEAIETGFREAQAEVERLEKILSDYDSESEVRRLTVNAVNMPTRVSDELWQVLAASDLWHKRSAGAFDASLGALTRLWRQSRRSGQLPSDERIREALAHCGWKHVTLSAIDQTLHFDQEGVYLDFGAIGKGFIADRIFEVLVARGIESSMVNISGNMRLGKAPTGRGGWGIAISPLEDEGEFLRKLELANCSIATSGDLWQFSVIDGVRRSHILDPQTGLGVPGPLSATVVAPLATDADAMATAACILGPEHTLKMIEPLPDVHVLIAQREGDSVNVIESPGFSKLKSLRQ